MKCKPTNLNENEKDYVPMIFSVQGRRIKVSWCNDKIREQTCAWLERRNPRAISTRNREKGEREKVGPQAFKVKMGGCEWVKSIIEEKNFTLVRTILL